jgi:heme-degrading monooxygenase HmoA
MILELAEFTIRPGEQDAFDAAISRGISNVISKSVGFRRATVHKGIESPERYILQIEWERLENHTVDFRGSAAFSEWRTIVGPFFAEPPRVEHFSVVSSGWSSSGDATARRV